MSQTTSRLRVRLDMNALPPSGTRNDYKTLWGGFSMRVAWEALRGAQGVIEWYGLTGRIQIVELDPHGGEIKMVHASRYYRAGRLEEVPVKIGGDSHNAEEHKAPL